MLSTTSGIRHLLTRNRFMIITLMACDASVPIHRCRVEMVSRLMLQGCQQMTKPLHALRAVLLTVVLLSCKGQLPNSPIQWQFDEPIRVCTASIQDFGARCNGAPDPSLEEPVQPVGDAPPEGWCPEGEDFCGYDVAVFKAVASDIDLVEGKDYIHVCMGEKGFGLMIDDLAGVNRTLGKCDIATSTITATSEREVMGISFSRATHRSNLAIMTYAPLKPRGKWAFFEPLHKEVWIALCVTILVTPIFVFFFETIFSGRSMYSMHSGRFSLLHGMKEALWHSISHTLSIDVFKVNAFPSRLITVAYGFLVMILTNTYTAELAAFLTVAQLDTKISSVNDLRGKTVVTVTPYLRRLLDNHHIDATDRDGWDYEAMVRKLKAGVYTAIISDDIQLVPRSHQDESCALHILDDYIEPFDLAFAYRKGFPYGRLQTEVSNSLLRLSEAGSLADIEKDHVPPKPSCLESTEFSETNRVKVRSLWGLWIILASAIGLAAVSSIFHYFVLKHTKPEEQQLISARVKPMRDSLTKAITAPSVVEAFRSASSGRGNRKTTPDASTADAAQTHEASLSAEGRGLWKTCSNKLSTSRNDNAVKSLAVVTESHEECHLPEEHHLTISPSGDLNVQQVSNVDAEKAASPTLLPADAKDPTDKGFAPEKLHVQSGRGYNPATPCSTDARLMDAGQSASEHDELVMGSKQAPFADGNSPPSALLANPKNEDAAWCTADGAAARPATQPPMWLGQDTPRASQQGMIAEAVAVLQGPQHDPHRPSSSGSLQEMMLPGPPNMIIPGFEPSPPFGPSRESSARSAGSASISPEQVSTLRSELTKIVAVLSSVDRRVEMLMRAMSATQETG
jgi:hypothetical protein